MSRFNVANAGWSGGALAWLRENWPHQTKYELSVVLGCTPNAVVGKAHRMDLPCKPSPIKRATPITKRTHKPHRKSTNAAPRKPKAPKPPKPPKAPLKYRRPYDGIGCAWPEGDPGAIGFHMCGGDPVNGSPYCDDHYKRAYVPRRPAEAAA